MKKYKNYQAIKSIASGSSIAIGGYGPLGVPQSLIDALAKTNAKDLTLYTSSVGKETYGITPLLKAKQVKNVVTSNIEDNEVLLDLYKKGEISVNVTPMGTLAEKLRSGGMGIPAFYTHCGVGTVFQNGGLPVKLNKKGKIEDYSEAKESRDFDGKHYILEKTILADYSFVKAWKADKLGNCYFKMCGQNFNSDVGPAGKICIVEADEIVEPGQIDGDDVHLSGVFVHRVIKSENKSNPVAVPVKECNLLLQGPSKEKRIKILKRAAKEIQKNWTVYLGNGFSRLAYQYANKEADYFTETGLIGANYADLSKADGSTMDGDYNIVGVKKNSSIAKSSDTFSAIRGGHLDLIIAEAYQVSQKGDLANWAKGNGMESPLAIIDQVNSGIPLLAIMEHVNSEGKSNLVFECSLKLTGRNCVSGIITDKGVFRMIKDKLTLVEIASDMTVEALKSMTEAEFTVAPYLKKME